MTIAGGPIWRADREGLLLGDTVVSFQRFLCPASKIVFEVPSSHGTLPVWPERDHFVLALPSAEAFWVGILLPKDWDGGTLSVAITQPDGNVLLIEHFARPGFFVVPGVKRPDGQFDVFSHSLISALQLDRAAGSLRVLVCDPQNFQERTGQPPPEPFDPRGAFGRWLLP